MKSAKRGAGLFRTDDLAPAAGGSRRSAELRRIDYVTRENVNPVAISDR